MDDIMDPYADELMDDTVTLSLFGQFSGGGALKEPMNLDAYLRAVGAIPEAAAPAPAAFCPCYGGPQTEPRDIDEYPQDIGAGAFPAPSAPPGFAAGYGAVAVKVEDPAPTRLPPPPGFPAHPSPPCAKPGPPGVLDGYQMQLPVHAPACRAPPPGFPPLPARARAEPVYNAYVTPVGERYKLRTFKQIPALSNAVPPRIPPRPARAAPVTNDSAGATSRPPLCAPYDDDIDANLRIMEKDAAERPSPDYLKSKHRDNISRYMRAELVLWMDRFTREYDLAAGTLHRAVSYVDRFLSVRVLDSYTYTEFNLRLLGATAVYTAAKYESRSTMRKLNATKAARYGEFTEGKEAIIVTETTMVEALDYRLGGPTAETFVEHFTRYSQGEQELRVQRLALCYADQSLLNYGCLVYLPSMVAASAIFMARSELNTPGEVPWSAELQELTGYSSKDIGCCLWTMMNPQ